MKNETTIENFQKPLIDNSKEYSFFPTPNNLTKSQRALRSYLNMGSCCFRDDLYEEKYISRETIVAYRADFRNPFPEKDKNGIFETGFDVYSLKRHPTIRAALAAFDCTQD